MSLRICPYQILKNKPANTFSTYICVYLSVVYSISSKVRWGKTPPTDFLRRSLSLRPSF